VRRLLFWLASLALTVAGCASRGPVLAPHLVDGAPSLELQNTPFFSQDAYQCGPAALASILKASGIDITPAELVSQVYIPQRRGSLQVEMVAASRRYERIPYVIAPDLSALVAELQAGRPVLVLQNLGLATYPVWHYAVVVGYTSDGDTIILRSGTKKRLVVPAAHFRRTWGRAKHWGFVLLRSGDLPARPDRESYLQSVAAMEGLARPEVLLKAYAAARRRWPDSRVARFGEANALQALGQLEAAERAYRLILARYPRDSATRNNLAVALAAQGCYPQALATIDVALLEEAKHSPLRKTLLETRTEILLARQQSDSDPMTAPSHGCCLNSDHNSSLENVYRM
jgi:tetratricopeptide (TPR) repeat protein